MEGRRRSDPGSGILFRPDSSPDSHHATRLAYLIISSWPRALNMGAADAEHLLRPLILWHFSLDCGKPSIIHLRGIRLVLLVFIKTGGQTEIERDGRGQEAKAPSDQTSGSDSTDANWSFRGWPRLR